MRRRDLLKTAAAATLTAGVAPRLGRGAETLVFVGVADLSVLDPVVTGARPTRNAAYLVFDTLYGIDTNWKAQPQMVEGHTVEEDGLTWTLKLRDGLRFHDNEPVLARDVVASIRRFAPRVIFANALMDATDELSAPDDRTVQFRLKRPFRHLPEALAGPGGNVPAIMPARLAAESPFKPVAELVGSGPYRFLKDEHVSGARAVFERFAEYQPRAGGALGFTTGPKVAHFERVEWLTLDPFCLFGTGSPLGSDVGIEVLRSPRDYAAVKRALAAAGYKGEKIVVIVPTDVSEIGNLTRTGAEQLRRAGMNIELQEMDAGSVVRKRNNQGPPDKGGYNMFCTLIDRSLPNVHPYGNLAIRADGKEPINGWADSPRIEELRAAWLDTADLEQQKRICVDLQKQLWKDVPFIPLGEYWQATAYRKDLTDVLPGCFAVFYGVRRV
jgi:ABC-type transport system substrate-binding protein